MRCCTHACPSPAAESNVFYHVSVTALQNMKPPHHLEQNWKWVQGGGGSSTEEGNHLWPNYDRATRVSHSLDTSRCSLQNSSIFLGRELRHTPYRIACTKIRTGRGIEPYLQQQKSENRESKCLPPQPAPFLQFPAAAA